MTAIDERIRDTCGVCGLSTVVERSETFCQLCRKRLCATCQETHGHTEAELSPLERVVEGIAQDAGLQTTISSYEREPKVRLLVGGEDEKELGRRGASMLGVMGAMGAILAGSPIGKRELRKRDFDARQLAHHEGLRDILRRGAKVIAAEDLVVHQAATKESVEGIKRLAAARRLRRQEKRCRQQRR